MVNKQHKGGYTLIEVLVAMVILALSLTIIFRIFSGGLLKIEIAADYTHAAMVAESVLAATGTTERLIAGDTAGEMLSKYQWRRSVTPYQNTESSWPGNEAVNAYKVTVIVEWPAREGVRSVDLSTLKLARIPEHNLALQARR